jgi:hypothetical protein
MAVIPPIKGKLAIDPFRVVLSDAMTYMDATHTAPRSWRERLFSWPWRPWVATKPVPRFMPRKDAILLADGRLVMHPTTYRALQENVEHNARSTQ